MLALVMSRKDWLLAKPAACALATALAAVLPPSSDQFVKIWAQA